MSWIAKDPATPALTTSAVWSAEEVRQTFGQDFVDILDAWHSSTRTEKTRCDACRYSVHELVATGLLGCPVCYASFEGTIRAQLGLTDLVS